MQRRKVLNIERRTGSVAFTFFLFVFGEEKQKQGIRTTETHVIMKSRYRTNIYYAGKNEQTKKHTYIISVSNYYSQEMKYL